MIVKIISGGQSGADQAGLIAASTLNIATGGWAPQGWLTEEGPAAWLSDLGLRQADKPGYSYRTKLNVMDSDGTLLFGDPGSPGSRLTMELCHHKKLNRRLFIVNWAGSLRYDEATNHQGVQSWLEQWKIRILNVAGNRESVMPGIGERVVEFLIETLKRRNDD